MSTNTPAPAPAYEKALTKYEVNLQDNKPVSSRFQWTETFRRPDGTVANETHTPEYLDDTHGELAKAALGDLAAAQALHIEAQNGVIKDHLATIATKDAELAAKDANLARSSWLLADTQAKLDAEILAHPDHTSPAVEGGDPASTVAPATVPPVVEPLPVHPLLVPDAAPPATPPTP